MLPWDTENVLILLLGKSMKAMKSKAREGPHKQFNATDRPTFIHFQKQTARNYSH